MKTYILMTKIIQESMLGIKDVKLLTAEDSFYEEYKEKREENLFYKDLRLKYESLPPHIIETVTAASLVFYLCLSLLFSENPGALLPEISALSLAVLRLVPASTRINNSLTKIFYYEPMIEKVDHELFASLDFQDKEKKTEISFKEQILFEQVSYHYPNLDYSVIENLSINIKAGEKVGIMGPSGEGKATFVDILLGLLPPQKGKIIVDSFPLQGVLDETNWLYSADDFYDGCKHSKKHRVL